LGLSGFVVYPTKRFQKGVGALVTGTKPDKDFLCAFVYVSHLLNLMALLSRVFLVNADGVDPEENILIWTPNVP
jgi:hypothetical protein